MGKSVVLLGCGDIGPIHEPMAQYSELVRHRLAEADIRFAQVERVYSERGELQPHGGAHGRLPPHMASVITDCGFNVVSVAGNHAMDWGAEALLDTIDLLRAKGIQAIGAGRNLAEARQPALIDAKDLRWRCWPIARCTRAMPPVPTRRAWRRCSARRAVAGDHDSERAGSGGFGRRCARGQGTGRYGRAV
ncbi:MAG TPA: CapA family protein, partial [Stellaceae bacterium]|nr:CapA family protein [Stellaceae bacterium]